jgi:hypothetical protein
MKKNLPNLLLATSLLTLSVSIAQPTLTAAGINAVVGNSFVNNITNYVSQGAAGANQTWDLSALTISSTSTLQTVTSSSTGSGASFPNSNICEVDGPVYLYYKTSSTAWQVEGNITPSSSSPIVMPYSNPEDLMRYPFTYNNSYKDPWTATYTSGGSTYIRKGTDSITGDSYGTLKLPTGTYSNVLRVHLVQYYIDSTNIGGSPFIISYQNDEYMWYLNGNHYPIATVSTLSTDFGGGPTVTQNGSYTSGIVAGIKDEGSVLGGCHLYPNPATSHIKLELGLDVAQRIEVKLFNSIGEQINSTLNVEGVQGANTYTIDIATLPEGIYFAQINLDGTLATTKRFIITK